MLAGLVFLAVSPLLFGQLSVEGIRPLAHVDFWTPLVLGVAALVGAWRLQHLARREAPNVLGNVSLLGLAQLLLRHQVTQPALQGAPVGARGKPGLDVLNGQAMLL